MGSREVQAVLIGEGFDQVSSLAVLQILLISPQAIICPFPACCGEYGEASKEVDLLLDSNPRANLKSNHL
jgi:hypothetical protein